MSARWVLPISAPPIGDGAVIVADTSDGPESGPAAGTIVAVGPRVELRRAYPALPEWRAKGALMPALVNAHCHLELSGAGGLVPGGDGVVAWTRRLGTRLAETAATAADTAVGAAGAVARPGAAEAVAAAAAIAAREFGTAAIGDVGNGVTGWMALATAKLEGVFFHELVGSREARTGDALGDAARERRTVARAAIGEQLARCGIPAVPAPHAPYSVGPDLLQRIFAAAARTGRATTIHLAEDDDEVRLLRDGSGAWPAVLRALGVSVEERTPRLSPTAYLERLGAFATPRPPLLVHMVRAGEEDLRRARQFGCPVVLCPRSNLHIGGRLPDVTALINAGLHLAVGTDSLASVSDLSPWQEVTTLATHFPEVEPGIWLRAATIGGAAALGLDHLGALEPGRRPGLLDVRIAPDRSDDPERALVSDPSPVLTWIDGAGAALPAADAQAEAKILRRPARIQAFTGEPPALRQPTTLTIQSPP